MLKKLLSAMSLAGLVVASSPASASITVGGYTFADNAFADTLISSVGTLYVVSGGSPATEAQVASALTDTDAGTYVFSTTTGSYVELGFTDNQLFNGAGADLVLFDLGDRADAFTLRLTISGTSLTYTSSWTGSSVGTLKLNAVAINLDDFSVASGAGVASVVIGLDSGTPPGSIFTPALSLVGALNSRAIPEPSALALSALGLLGLAASRRRKTHG